MPIVPSTTRQYELVIRPYDGSDCYITEIQEADAYYIHNIGYHVFVTHGRIVRVIVGHRLIDLKELPE